MSRLKIKELDSPEWLRQKYWEEELTAKAIGELLGCSKPVVLRRMREHNIPARSNSQSSILTQGYAQYRNREWLQEYYVEKKLSSHEIARQIGCGFQTVCRWLDELNIPRRDWVAQFRYENRESSWNDKFFDTLTPDGAYIIGLIIAEGSLSRTDTSRNRVQIAQKDRTILDKISGIVCGGNFNKVNNSWALTLNSKHAHEVLTGKFNLPTGREKSYTVRIPDCILERDDLLPHCIRGIFDGDGSINEYGNSLGFSSGSLGLLNDIVSVLTRLVSLPNVEPQWALGGYIKKNGERSGAYYIDYGGILDAIDFAKFIYGPSLDVYGSTLYLERKRERFQPVCDRWHGREWLCEQIDNCKTNEDIAIEINVPINRVARVLNGIGVYDFPYKDPEWLKTEFVHNGRSVWHIADDYNVRADHVGYYIDKYGLREARSRHWNLELGI